MTDIGTILSQWQSYGVYEYLLPFLLVFSLVFGILTTTNILGKHKGIHVIIAVIIGLMAVGYNYGSGFSFGEFLQVLSPKLAVGLSILMAVLILIGLLVPEDDRRYWMWGLGAIALVIAIVIVIQTFDAVSGFSVGSYEDYVGWIIAAILLIGLIIAVATSGDKDNSSKPPKGPAVIGYWNK